MRARVLNRKLHRWGAILIALPLLVVIASGILLQLKKEIGWIQPGTIHGSTRELEITFAEILHVAKGVERAKIRDWGDVERLDVRPGKGMLKVRAKSGVEIQVDTKTGELLQVADRRSDLIEAIHDGSFFHDTAKLWIFLPSAVILLGLLGTGIYLFFLPVMSRRRRDRRRESARAMAQKIAV